MRLTITFLFFSLTFSSFSQIPLAYQDENGIFVNEKNFLERWYDIDNQLVRWDYIRTDTVRVAFLRKNFYDSKTSDYSYFKKYFEKITGKKYPEGTTFLISYNYYNDLCSSFSTNHHDDVSAERIAGYLHRSKKKKKRKYNLEVIMFFEKGITFENPEKFPTLHPDEANILRNLIFTSRTLCGSNAIFKPNNEVLVVNGEVSSSHLLEVFKSEKKWTEFFPASDKE